MGGGREWEGEGDRKRDGAREVGVSSKEEVMKGEVSKEDKKGEDRVEAISRRMLYLLAAVPLGLVRAIGLIAFFLSLLRVLLNLQKVDASFRRSVVRSLLTVRPLADFRHLSLES